MIDTLLKQHPDDRRTRDGKRGPLRHLASDDVDLLQELRRKADHDLSIVLHRQACRINFREMFSFTSAWRGTSSNSPVRGFRYKECLPPSRTNSAPRSSSSRISDRRFIDAYEEGVRRRIRQRREHHFESCLSIPPLYALDRKHRRSAGWNRSSPTTRHRLGTFASEVSEALHHAVVFACDQDTTYLNRMQELGHDPR